MMNKAFYVLMIINEQEDSPVIKYDGTETYSPFVEYASNKEERPLLQIATGLEKEGIYEWYIARVVARSKRLGGNGSVKVTLTEN